ncbi:hypothetical protein G7046_g10008 [Stylonectria norvegica]|nr:hypothetical protein G7046_g10008 [Stylonectria norvegica]
MGEGDVVAVLYGGRTPFVLREVDGGWVLLGECYVHGLMEGEALKDEGAVEEVLTSLTTMSVDRLDSTLSVADYQRKFDEISAIREAAKVDGSISNNEKRQIAEEFNAARCDLRAASQAAMESTSRSPSNTPDASS